MEVPETIKKARKVFTLNSIRMAGPHAEAAEAIGGGFTVAALSVEGDEMLSLPVDSPGGSSWVCVGCYDEEAKRAYVALFPPDVVCERPFTDETPGMVAAEVALPARVTPTLLYRKGLLTNDGRRVVVSEAGSLKGEPRLEDRSGIVVGSHRWRYVEVPKSDLCLLDCWTTAENGDVQFVAVKVADLKAAKDLFDFYRGEGLGAVEGAREYTPGEKFDPSHFDREPTG